MRSLKIFFRMIFFGLLSVAGAFLIGRELLVLYTSFTLSDQVNTIKILSKNSDAYAQGCVAKFPDLRTDDALEGFQLRFTDETHYIVESVCKFHEAAPIQIRKGVLPSFSKRIAGSSGLFFDPSNAPSKFGVEVLGRSSTVAIGSVGDAVEPATSCTGWGYQCCDAQLQISGGADAGSKALDCPGRCFAQCKSRPVVLSFRSDPEINQARVVTLTQTNGSAEQITFTYVVSDPDGKVATVLLDFGDGQSQTFTDTQSIVTHDYACSGSAAHCSFTARLSVVDNEGNDSPDLSGGKIQVKL